MEGTIKKSDFDPATAMEDMTQAVQAIQNANERADDLINAFKGIELHPVTNFLEEEMALVRVEFRSDASIHNVVDWRDWSEKWHEIARGVAMSVGEAPENVHVVGATRGSLIIELAGTYLFVSILTGIVRAVTSVAKDLVMLSQSVEDLRSKQLLNEKIESELNAEADARKNSGVNNIINDTKTLLPGAIDGEQNTALTRAITQLLDFHRKGGEVDFVAPEESHPDDGEESDPGLLQITELRQAIEELRIEKEELKRLKHDDRQ